MKEQGYQYTTDLLVIGCGFSGMWAAMRARDFLGDVLVVDKGPRDWGGLGGLSGGDMIVKQPDMKLDDLLDDLVYYYDGLADQKLLGQILTQSYDRFMDFENLGHKFVRNDKGELCFIPQRALDYMRYYYYHPYGMGGIEKARLLKQECEKRGVRRLGRTVITDVITDGERVTGAVGFHSQSGFGGFGGRSTQAKGSDLHSEVSVSFEEAAFGCDRVMRLSDPSGNGVTQTLKVHVPAGIEDGKNIRLKGKGNPGFNGGPAGDLFLKVNVASKPGFERKGMDIYTTANIPFTTAVFGGEAKVTTLYGDVICKIPEGTQSGRKIRLKGKGIVSMKDSAVHGNQYVTVQIQVPQNLSPEAKEKLREFQQVLRKDTQKRRGSAA